MVEILDNQTELTFDSMQQLVQEIQQIIKRSQCRAASVVNQETLEPYWNIGCGAVEFEQNGEVRGEYGKQMLKELSRRLTKELGKGFSRSSLQNMRSLHLNYEKCQTLSGKSTWSHYCEVLGLSDSDERHSYEQECINACLVKKLCLDRLNG